MKVMNKRALLIPVILVAFHTSLPRNAFCQTDIRTHTEAAAIGNQAQKEAQGKYAEVNGLKIY